MLATSEKHLSTAETAQALGVTPRALRLYERRGLVTPARTQAGWRVYGPEALARLHQILTLKRFGLSLAAIGELLAGRLARLETVLALQEEALAKRLAEAERGLALVRAARQRLTAGGALSLDELTTLTRETAMTKDMPGWAKEMQPIVDKHFSEADRAAWAKKAGAYDQAAVSAQWEALIVEANALVGTDPGAPKAQDLARRWREMTEIKSGADPNVRAKIREVWQDAMADPKLAPKLPFGPEVMQFIAAAAKHLKPKV
jgi:DNA-binding transcriptional MerR regulator